jgi:uncharacterized heparinase superfamily protein
MIGSRIENALLLVRTTRNLRPTQVLHRVRLRAQRFPPSRPMAASVIGFLPGRDQLVAGWPEGFIPLDRQLAEGYPSPEDNADGRFAFLNEQRDLGRPINWDPRGASRLWSYHLHYLEWAWSFAAHADRQWARTSFSELWRSWAAADAFGRGDRWSPYVASLRAWALCGTYDVLSRGSDIQAAIDASLALHARFLRWHIERDVGGNHLVKNLKAMIGLAVFLDDQQLLGIATGELRRQLSVQVLADGGHYERSPSYHCQVLADLIDIAGLLASKGVPPVSGLAGAIDAMRTWLGLMLMPDGDVPLFNDCVRVGSPRISALGAGPPATGRLTVLPASGYVVVRPDDRLHLVADVGDPCPPDLPAHAHADCLSFELAADGRRLVVDSGTSTYAPGRQRRHERSTAAHNTVTIDGADQTEVWGIFRAARLARGRLLRAEDDGQAVTVVASHDGYRRLPGRPTHQRTWRVDGYVEITDEIGGEGTHRIESRIYLADPGTVKAAWTGPPGLIVTEGAADYATGFGAVHDGHVTCASWQGKLPVTVRVELHVDGDVPQAVAGESGYETKGNA